MDRIPRSICLDFYRCYHFAQAAQIVNFEVGMSLVSFSVSGTTYTQSTAAAVGYVIAVNRSTGVLTVSATQGGAAGTPTNWSTSFPYWAWKVTLHSVQSVQRLPTRKSLVSGAWIPSTAPGGSDSFWE